MKIPGKRTGGKGRRGKNTFITKSGKAIKVHHTLVQRWVARRDARQQRRAERMAGLPKSRVKRFFYHFQPKRMYKYWFSRDGAIMALKLTGIGILVGFLVLFGAFAYFRKDLPNLKDISGSNIGGSIRYYDRSGQTLLWEDYDAVKRIPVKDEDIAQHIKNATIAIEDKDFFKHGGFDVRGIMRAGFNNVFGKGDSKQGGSTITQQLVRLTQTAVGKEQTYTRKIKELILSVELERSYSKQEILTGYLNTAPYGGIEYGVEAAARDYFQKSAKDLTLAESAYLAAIPKSPRYYSKYSADFDQDSAVGRAHYILDLMQQQGMISKEEKEAAKQIDVIAAVKPRLPKYDGIKAPWFVLAAKEQLEEKFGAETVDRGGWRVTTTLDMRIQGIAEDEVNKGMAQVRRQGGDTAAFVSEDVKTGQIVALVGGSDFSNQEFGQNNYARLRLPPGSSFKPYDYLALMENGEKHGAGTVIYDTQGPLEGYPCTNKAIPKNGGNCLYDYDLKYPGPVTIRYALGGSRNVPAVKAMLMTGVDKTIETAEKLGLDSGYNCYADDNLTKEAPCYASSSIGDGAYMKLDEHVHAYSTMSRNGLKLPRTYILKIEDAGGKVIDEWKPDKGEQVVRPDSAYIISDILSDPKASYFSTKIHEYNGHKFSLKTGTTNDTKDGLLMGYSTKYASGIWVGYHSRRVEMRGFMETMTRPIWNGFMKRVHDGVQPEERARPSGVQTLPAFVVRNHVGTGSIEPSPTNDLFPSWYKSPQKSNNKQTIDIVSNKLATECTPARAKQNLDNADASIFSGDTLAGNQSANTTEKDDIHKCGDALPSVSFVSPPSTCSGCTFTVSISQGTHAISSDKFKGTVHLVVDGHIVFKTEIGGPGLVSLPYSGDASGSKTVTAEIIDSVLYENSSAITVNFSSGSVFLNSPSVSGNNASFTWTGGQGPFTVYVTRTTPSGFSSNCSASDNDCTANISGAGTYQAYVKDNTTGQQSNTVTFTKT